MFFQVIWLGLVKCSFYVLVCLNLVGMQIGIQLSSDS